MAAALAAADLEAEASVEASAEVITDHIDPTDIIIITTDHALAAGSSGLAFTDTAADALADCSE